MLKDFMTEYRQKLCTPEEAVEVVKSGDWVDYTSSLGKPVLLDKALAKRRDELFDVKIRGNLVEGPIEVAECDETQEHFVYHTWHCSAYERKLCDRGLCYYIPMVFHNNAAYYKYFLNVNVVMVSVSPMDKHGYFNYSVNTGVAGPIVQNADVVIVEVNEHMPKIHGGYGECIHVSEVDYIVEGKHEPFTTGKPYVPSEIDRKIAQNLLPYICDGATLQLGIGSMPNALGELIAETDRKDLGMHTELCSDAYLHLYKAGKLTNKKKTIDRGKGVFGVAIGSSELYEWLDDNHGVAAYPLEYVNRPDVIAQIDNMVSINSCVSVDIRCNGSQFQRNKLCSNCCTNVGTKCNTNGLFQCKKSGIYKADFHNGGCTRRLDNRSKYRAKNNCNESILCYTIQNDTHLITRSLLQPLTHELHTE